MMFCSFNMRKRNKITYELKNQDLKRSILSVIIGVTKINLWGIMMKDERIGWPAYFMMQAAMLASRSTCTRLHVGAVVVKDGRIIASGYNGSVTGTPHCTEVGDLIVDGHCIRAVHAEQNALMQLAKWGLRQKALRFTSQIFLAFTARSFCYKRVLRRLTTSVTTIMMSSRHH